MVCKNTPIYDCERPREQNWELVTRAIVNPSSHSTSALAHLYSNSTAQPAQLVRPREQSEDLQRGPERGSGTFPWPQKDPGPAVILRTRSTEPGTPAKCATASGRLSGSKGDVWPLATGRRQDHHHSLFKGKNANCQVLSPAEYKPLGYY